MSEVVYQGCVKWFNHTRGYGFITIINKRIGRLRWTNTFSGIEKSNLNMMLNKRENTIKKLSRKSNVTLLFLTFFII